MYWSWKGHQNWWHEARSKGERQNQELKGDDCSQHKGEETGIFSPGPSLQRLSRWSQRKQRAYIWNSKREHYRCMQVSVARQKLVRGIENCKLLVSNIIAFTRFWLITILPTGQAVFTLEAARLEKELPWNLFRIFLKINLSHTRACTSQSVYFHVLKKMEHHIIL